MHKIIAAALLTMSSAGFAQVKIGEPYKIESDPSATYYNLEIKGDGNIRTIVTKRVGKSGTSFSKREVDCKAGMFRYLGDGDTLAEMKASKPSPNMAPLTERSISAYVAAQACAYR